MSVSLDRADLATMKRVAKASYGGNLSAAFSDAARWLRQREARRRLVDLLGGPTLSQEQAELLDAELAHRPRRRSKGGRGETAA